MSARAPRHIPPRLSFEHTAQRLRSLCAHQPFTAAHAARFRRTVLAFYSACGRDLPWRRSPLPYHVLVSEIMLQQTRVEIVIPYYKLWMRRFPTIAALAQAHQQEVLAVWEGLGYYGRARNLHRAAQLVMTK